MIDRDTEYIIEDVMKRNWGIPARDAQRAMQNAKSSKPAMTLFISAVFGVIGVAVAAMSFAEARNVIANLFHGGSLVAAIVAAGFGCWSYVWLARPRFAAQFSEVRDGFSSLLRFYARAALGLAVLLILGVLSIGFSPPVVSVLILCASGGAGAAAAFQTVLAFVPHYE